MRKRCVRKHWALVDPIAHAIVGASIASEARLDRLRLKELSAIEAFSKGKATPGDFRDICDLLNVTETLGEMGIGPEALEWCEKVEKALLRVKGQYEKHSCMTLRSDELMAMLLGRGSATNSRKLTSGQVDGSERRATYFLHAAPMQLPRVSPASRPGFLSEVK